MIHKGLKGITIAETALSLIDGEQGLLLYRGYNAGDLAVNRSFEDVAHLLWIGHLPEGEAAATFQRSMANQRHLPEHVATLLDLLPANVEMMDVLRTAISAMGAPEFAWSPTVNQAVSLAAKFPTIIARRYRRLQGQEPIAPRDDLTHAANYLYMLTGQEPTAAQAGALEAYLVLTAEHGMNASTFSGRVTASTEADMVAALTTALGTMKGPLHGGAPSHVDTMLEEIGTPDRAEPYLRHLLACGGRIMGFGHRVYKTRDPRGKALSVVARRLAGDDKDLQLAVRVEELAEQLLEEYKPGRRLYTNVEYWAAAVLKCVAMPPELYTPTFSVARAVGWTAHILEQAADNQLIRPDARYVGPLEQK